MYSQGSEIIPMIEFKIPFQSLEKIPEGYKVCPVCNGTGRIRYQFSEPSIFLPEHDFIICIYCGGTGYVEANQ